MMILPSPFAKYEQAQKKQAQETRQKALAAPIPGGEVSAAASCRRSTEHEKGCGLSRSIADLLAGRVREREDFRDYYIDWEPR